MQSARYSRSRPLNVGSCRAARCVPGGSTARTRSTTPCGSSPPLRATLAGRSDVVAVSLVATEILWIGKPRNRLGEPALEALAPAIVRAPAHGPLGLLDAGKQAFDLARAWTQPLGICFDLDI